MASHDNGNPNHSYLKVVTQLEATQFSQLPESEVVPTCASIVRAARIKGDWIYDPKAHEWYSPDEFDKAFSNYVRGHEVVCKRVKLMHPNEGIDAGFKKLDKDKEKLNSFVKRVISWSQDIAKKQKSQIPDPKQLA